jgi:hypothetical protein
MLFMVIYSLAPQHRDAGQARFKQTGGQPPEGARMLGRWHDVAGLRGWVLAEADNALPLARWTQDWSDLLDFQVVPLLTDEDFGKLLGA